MHALHPCVAAHRGVQHGLERRGQALQLRRGQRRRRAGAVGQQLCLNEAAEGLRDVRGGSGGGHVVTPEVHELRGSGGDEALEDEAPVAGRREADLRGTRHTVSAGCAIIR